MDFSALQREMSRRQALGRGRHLIEGCVAVTISARALGLSPAVARVPEKIIVGRLPYNTTSTLYAGATDILNDADLKLEFLSAVAGPALVQALAAGSVPAADVGVGPALISSARGLPIVAPMSMAIGTPSQPWERIMTQAKSSIHSVADLKGKSIAVAQRGTMADLELIALKKVHGVGLQDVELAIVPAPNQPLVLEQGQVDAIYALPPYDTVAERRYGARTVINAADFIPYVGYTTLAIRTDFIDAYPDATKKLIKVFIRLSRWINDNAKQADEEVGRVLGIDQDLRPFVRRPYFARNGLPVLPNVWHMYYLLVEGKLLDPVDDPAKLINASVIEPAKRLTFPALEEVGEQPDPEIVKMLGANYPMLPKPTQNYYADWERKLVSQ